MTEAAGSRRRIVVVVAGAALLLGAAVAIVVLDPIGSLVRDFEPPEGISPSDLPDVPRWLLWALGKIKFVVIAAVLLVVAVREMRKRRGA
jgi:hypothetical protein